MGNASLRVVEECLDLPETHETAHTRSGESRMGAWAGRGALTLLVVLTVTIFPGCSGSEESSSVSKPAGTPAAAAPAKPVPDAATVTAEADQIFNNRCATCHGPEGKGDGPGSTALDPKPRNFQDPQWQDSVSDDHIAKIIQYGGAAVGKAPMMPGNPDLMSKPEVVAALVKHVRSLRGGS